MFPFFLKRKLGRDAPSRFKFAHPPLLQTLDLLFWRAPHHNEPVQDLRHASFHKQRCFHKHSIVHPASSPFFELPHGFGSVVGYTYFKTDRCQKVREKLPVVLHVIHDEHATRRLSPAVRINA